MRSSFFAQKRKLMFRLNVWHNGSMHNLSLSQQEGTFSSHHSWWTCAGPRLRCRCVLDGNFLPASHWTAGKEERHSDPLPMLSTTQFPKPIVKSFSHQCGNSQSPCIFHVQRFGDGWRIPWDFLSSIKLASLSTWQMRSDKFESIGQTNCPDS
jgi:hypothetical protein